MTQPYGLYLVPQHLSADDESLNLTRTLENLDHLCTPHSSGHWVFLGVAIASEDLNRICGDLHRYVGREALSVSRFERIPLS